MTAIPEDVMIEARRIALEVLAESGIKVALQSEIKIATRAIMAERERFMNEFEGAADGGIDAAIAAERERCAEIAESYSNSEHIARDMAAGTFPNKSRIQDAIAAKIRSDQP